MSDNEENTQEETQYQQPAKQRKESISEKMSDQDEKPVIILGTEEFSEWADDSRLEVPLEESLNGNKIQIRQALVKGSGLLEFTVYNVVGEDQNSKFDVERRYSEFNYLRKKLKERWPGVFIPAIPNKKMLNKNETQVTKNRQRFLGDFLHKIGNTPYLYQTQQVQLFLKGEGSDIVKVLEKLKKQQIPQLLKRYQQAFPDCINKNQISKQIEQITKFDQFLKATEKGMQQLKKQSRQLAESRDKYNSLSTSVFENILPRYEINTLVEFIKVDESDCIFTSSELKDNLEGLKNSSQYNPYWLIYDLLKFEQREAKGMKETIEQVGQLRSQRQDMLKKIQINKQEIAELSQGKTTLRSLIIPGNKEQIVTKLTAQNQKLQVHKDYLLQIINIVTFHLHNQILKFKQTRIRFFNKTIKKAFSNQMHNAQMSIEYNSRLDKATQRFIEQ